MSAVTDIETRVEQAVRSAELTVVVPTLNERDNIGPMVELLGQVLHGIAWEVVFVDDDSSDGTVERIRQIAAADSRVRGIHRIGRRGLSSACIEGMLSSSAPYIAVTDADLQHDETLLPAMLKTLKEQKLDIVIGSRYIEGGSAEGLNDWRSTVSQVATKIAQRVIKIEVGDPMSGFFMLTRPAFERSVRNLSAIGFKILLDLFASHPGPLKFKELPYQFRERQHGESKLDSMVIWEYLMLLFDKRCGGLVPARFVMFGAVGGLGLGVHLVVLGGLMKYLAIPFGTAQAAATLTAMVFNFTLNNVFTYRDRRLKGWGFAWGLLTFCLVCGIGGIANVGASAQLFGGGKSWWLSGIAGAFISSIWNYVASSIFTWRGGSKKVRSA
jgi:dolichol-phosphate mannosyltransferase